MAGLLGGSSDLYSAKSGRASQMSFLGVNSSLAEKAMRYQKFENDISKMAYKLLEKNVEEFEEVKYPSSFDITALADEVDSMFSIMERNFSPRLNKTIMKNIARKAVPLAQQKDKEEIENEIESGDGIVEPINKKEEGMLNEDGTRNTKGLASAFKSKDKLDKEEKGKQKRKEE